MEPTWMRRLAGALVLASAASAGCAITIPASDATPPRVELTISGPGIGTRTMTNPPRARWVGDDGAQLFTLLPDARYTFRVVVSDPGGVGRAHLRVPLEFTVIDLSPAAVRNEPGPLQRSLTLIGSRGDPRNGLVITGSFRTHASGILAFDFNVEGDDFGGASGAPNRTAMSVQVNAGS